MSRPFFLLLVFYFYFFFNKEVDQHLLVVFNFFLTLWKVTKELKKIAITFNRQINNNREKVLPSNFWLLIVYCTFGMTNGIRLKQHECRMVKFSNWIEFCLFVSLIQNLNSLFFLLFLYSCKNQDMFANC